MLESGRYRADLIATATFGLEDSFKAFESAALRATVSAHVVF
jgi:hypothetical protein